jgi:arylsulfatase A-like enzyme
VKRRRFLKAAGAAAAGLVTGRAAAAATTRPNLLIIHTDEHNFRTLGCYRKLLPPEQALVWGKEAVCPTPHIDRIAAEGAVATSFYATTPVCSPSRSALVSGMYPQNTPVVQNNIPMQGEVVTFAEILRRQGYATGYAGKWHLEGTGKPQWKPERQFGFTDNRYMFNRGHWKQLEETAEGPRVKARKNGKPTYGVEGADETSFTTDFLADRCVEFIDAHQAEPFCYMLSIPDPHGPNTVRPPYDTMFDGMAFEDPRTMHKPDKGLPSWGQKQARTLNGKQMARYFGMVKCIDDNVGKILKALEAAGVLEKTIVVFTSDHGDLCGEHGRHNKGVPYEASARIPFVIRCPARIPAGTVVRQALSCVDVLPTLVRLMGFKTTGAEQGRDASALFCTGRAPEGWTDVAFVRSTGRSNSGRAWLAAVTPRHKLVYSDRDEPWLFDLAKDPDEVVNFFADPAYADVVRSLSKQLIGYADRYGDPYVEAPNIRDALFNAVGKA